MNETACTLRVVDAVLDAVEGFFSLPPQRVAVVMVDFQHDFCSPVVFGDRPVTNTHNAQTARRANSFARQARDLGARVVYTQQILDFNRLTERQRRWNGSTGSARWGPGELNYSSSLCLAPRLSSRIGSTAGRACRSSTSSKPTMWTA